MKLHSETLFRNGVDGWELQTPTFDLVVTANYLPNLPTFTESCKLELFHSGVQRLHTSRHFLILFYEVIKKIKSFLPMFIHDVFVLSLLFLSSVISDL